MSSIAKKAFSRELAASVCAIVFAGVFAFGSFFDADPEVYLFPRIVCGFMIVLGLLQLISAISAGRSEHSKQVVINWGQLLPGILVIGLFVFLSELFGFYVSAFLAFFAIVSLYGKRSAFDVKAAGYKLIVSTVFIAILYGLFWKLLYVRTPTGWFF